MHDSTVKTITVAAILYSNNSNNIATIATTIVDVSVITIKS